MLQREPFRSQVYKPFLSIGCLCLLEWPRAVGAQPCPPPRQPPALLWCWVLFLLSAKRLWNLVGGCIALEGSCRWDQSFSKLPAPQWPLSRQDTATARAQTWWQQEQCLCGAEAPAAMFSPPAPGRPLGHLASSSLGLSVPPSVSSHFFSVCNRYVRLLAGPSGLPGVTAMP